MSKILIVDDEPTNLLLAGYYLAAVGHDVLSAENGESALEQALQAGPDLILLDIQMPVMDGFAVCRALKSSEETTAIPVIFMSALTGQENKIKGFEHGAVDFITKPLLKQELLAKVNGQLQMRNLNRELQHVNAAMDALVRQRSEELLERYQQPLEKAAFHRRVISSIDQGFVIYGPDLKYRFFNSFMERVSGFSAEQAIGRSSEDIFPQVRNSPLPDALQAALAGRTVPAFDLLADYSSTWLSIKYAPIFDSQGRVDGVVGIAADITERKRFEDELQKFQQIVEQLPASVMATDRAGVIEYVNQQCVDQSGYAYHEVVGQNLLRFDPDHPLAGGAELQRAIASGAGWKGELQNRRRTGEPLCEQATVSPFYDMDDTLKGYILIREDVTARKTLQRQLEQSQKMEAIGLLAGGIAHDFNNILTVVHGIASLMRMDLHHDDPNIGNLDEVLSAAERGSELVNGMLAFSRKQVLHTVRCDLRELIESVARLLRRVIGEDISLELVFAAEPLCADIDRNQISQVLINLATNARDAMPHGGMLMIEADTVDGRTAGLQGQVDHAVDRYVRLRVSDTGSGIAKRDLDRIFDPFFSTKAEKGTGLGLSIVYGIVRQHGGHITVESRSGCGTTFHLYLPVSSGALPEIRVAERSMAVAETGATILVADDEPLARSYLQKLLTRFGYRVVTAGDGLEALQRFEEYQGQISLVLLDVMMPVMSGTEAYARMREMRPDLKALFLSGYSAELLLEKYGTQVGCELLSKPVLSAVLLERIRELLSAQTAGLQ